MGLADKENDPHQPSHVHIEPAFNSAEPESVPMEILLKLNWQQWKQGAAIRDRNE